MRRVLIASAVAAGVVLLSAAPAFANGGTAIGLNVTGSTITSMTAHGTDCTWDVVSSVTAVNLTNQTLTFGGFQANVNWTEPSNQSGVLTGVQVVQSGGLEAGDTLPPNGEETYSPFETTFTIPCAATQGDQAVEITTPLGTGSGDAPFLAGGSPLPIVAVGGIGLAVLLGLGLVVRQRRRQPAGAFLIATDHAQTKGT